MIGLVGLVKSSSQEFNWTMGSCNQFPLGPFFFHSSWRLSLPCLPLGRNFHLTGALGLKMSFFEFKRKKRHPDLYVYVYKYANFPDVRGIFFFRLPNGDRPREIIPWWLVWGRQIAWERLLFLLIGVVFGWSTRQMRIYVPLERIFFFFARHARITRHRHGASLILFFLNEPFLYRRTS